MCPKCINPQCFAQNWIPGGQHAFVMKLAVLILDDLPGHANAANLRRYLYVCERFLFVTNKDVDASMQYAVIRSASE